VSNEHGEEVVRLYVPAASEYTRVIRLTVSGVASRLGFDVNEIEDLRIAVDELANAVIAAGPTGELAIAIWSNGSQLRIEGSTPLANGATPAVDHLTAQILKAVVDEYTLQADDGAGTFTCSRRLPRA
jgi:serine/threonine-protein kinase RsbW